MTRYHTVHTYKVSVAAFYVGGSLVPGRCVLWTAARPKPQGLKHTSPVTYGADNLDHYDIMHISTLNTLRCQGKRPKHTWALWTLFTVKARDQNTHEHRQGKRPKHKRTHIFIGQLKTPCTFWGRPLFQAKTNRQLFYKVSRQISQLLPYHTTWQTGLIGNEERRGVPNKLLSVLGTRHYVGLKH